MKKIVIVDDHELIINGIKSMLSEVEEYHLVDTANNGIEAIEKASIHHPDLIIMDVSMPKMNGIEATKIIRNKFPDIKILILTQHESKEYVIELINVGADGYLLKNSKKEELLHAINVIFKNEKYLGNKMSEVILNGMIREKSHENMITNYKNILTDREIEIIKYLASDYNNQMVADKLGISLRTVETHRRNLMQKLNVKSVVALVHFALKNKIIEL